MDARRTMASLEDEEESVRIAVKALDDMRNQRTEGGRWSQPSTSSDVTLSPARDATSEMTPTSPALFTRMSSIPLVKSALTVYEQGKASSRVVKYGAQMVESSVKTLSRPVIDRLPVDQLDEFACRQLDRFDRYRRPSTSETSPSASSSHSTLSLTAPSDNEILASTSPRSPSTFDGSDSQSNRSAGAGGQSYRSRRAWMEGGERGVPSWIDTRASFSSSPSAERASTPTQRQGSQAEEGRKNGNRLIVADAEKTPTEETASNEQQVAQRSRWQAVLLEAGGLSAALSEESMRRLKYCLQWLQYATAHIDAQILILRELTARLQTNPPDAPAHARRPNPISEEHLRKLVEVRKDVVQTVRQVVNVVSKYTGGALPEPARTTVRGFILKLPQRWASKAAAVGVGAAGMGGAGAGLERERDSVTAAASGVAGRRNGTRRSNVARERGAGAGAEPRSGASSTVGSPTASPRITRSTLAPLTTMHPQTGHARLGMESGGGDEQSGSSSLVPNGQPVSHGAVIVAAERLLSLATESLDMMRGVTGVVKDSLDKAELWVSRLRTVGLQRAAQEGGEDGLDQGGVTGVPSEDGREGANVHEYHQLYRQHHRRSSSSTQFSDDMLDDTMPPSPFFTSQSGSSTAWGSSIPSTPMSGSGVYTPPNGMSGVVGGGGGGGGTQKSPALNMNAIPLGRMTLASRCNTPKSGVGELPGEDLEEGERMVSEDVVGSEREGRKGGGGGEVKIVGLDEGVAGRMDVDEV